MRPFSSRRNFFRNSSALLPRGFRFEISPEANHVRGRKEPRLLRHRLRGSSRSLLAAFLSLLYLGFWPGKAVTSSNCRLAAQIDDGAFFTKKSLLRKELLGFPRILSKRFSSVSLGISAQIALVRKSSVGRSLQVKDLALLRFAVRFWRALDLTFDQTPRKRCAMAPLLRKLRAPSVIETDSRKAWRAISQGSVSTEDLRSLISPRREVRSRKSECLGRAVSLSPC